MKTKFSTLLIAASVVLAQPTTPANAVGLITLTGTLHVDGEPANGFFDWDWILWNSPTGGTALVQGMTLDPMSVSNGVGNFLLEVGDLPSLGIASTQDVYLELAVRPTGSSNAFTVLSPRQRIVPSLSATSAGFAEQAQTLTQPLSPSLLPASVPLLDDVSTFTGLVTFSPMAGPPFAVGSSETVAGLTAELAESALTSDDSDKLDGYDSSEFWKLEGNAMTTAGVNFLGTTDDQALELKVNNVRAMRFEPTAVEGPNLIGGAPVNFAGPNVVGATISGGGAVSYGASPFVNGVSADFGTIGGGRSHAIDPGAYGATIGGGQENQIQMDASHATISGGNGNQAGSNALFAVIGGGFENRAGAAKTTIAGGEDNVVGVNSDAATIAGGARNSILFQSPESVIGGGGYNLIDESTQNATIGGGRANSVFNSAAFATVGGGVSNSVNQAALYATVAGGYNNAVGRASGTIGGGERNAVGSIGATVAGGIGNSIGINGKASVIGGGASNVVVPAVTNSVITGGFGNTVNTNAHYASIGGGLQNTVTAWGARIGGGFNNEIKQDAFEGVIAGGFDNVIEEDAWLGAIGGGNDNVIHDNVRYATIPGGRSAAARSHGQMAYASGAFSTPGDAQSSVYVARGTTPANAGGTSQAELFLDGAGQRMKVPSDSAWAFEALIVGAEQNGNAWAISIRGLIRNDGGATAMIGIPQTDKIAGSGSGTLYGASAVADNATDTLIINAWRNLADAPTRWVATVRTSEVIFP